MGKTFFTNRELIERLVAVLPDGCWIWLGSCDVSGYGRVNLGAHRTHDGQTRTMLAHRRSFELWRGAIPSGLVLDHVFCDEPSCVNPWHLEPRTHRQNILRGRGATAMNARKTHCKRGHEFTDENIIRMRSGGRRCRACDAARRVS